MHKGWMITSVWCCYAQRIGDHYFVRCCYELVLRTDDHYFVWRCYTQRMNDHYIVWCVVMHKGQIVTIFVELLCKKDG